MNNVGLPVGFTAPEIEYSSILPILILTGGALLILLFASLFRNALSNGVATTLGVLSALGSLVPLYGLWIGLTKDGALDLHSTIGGAVSRDHLSIVAYLVVGVVLALSLVVMGEWLHRKAYSAAEFVVLLMLASVGALILAVANDLLVLFVGLEILSIGFYVLVARGTRTSHEAGFKYFILGGTASAVLLFGVALVYGATGSTNYASVAQSLAAGVLVDNGMLLAGLVLIVVGVAFKLSLAPFHQWAPDVYAGAPSPIVGFMGGVAKAGALIAALRLFGGALSTEVTSWQPLFVALGLLSVLVGGAAAALQTNVKRLLAYSSVAHVGFMVLGLAASSLEGAASALYYLAIYSLLILGSFAVVWVVIDRTGSVEIAAFRALIRRNPLFGTSFVVLLLAQLGVPLTAGFLAKLYVIRSIGESYAWWVAIVAMVGAVVASFAYLRLVAAIVKPEQGDRADEDGVVGGVDSVQTVSSLSGVMGTGVIVVFASCFVLLLGIVPSTIVDLMHFFRTAAQDLYALDR